MDVRTTAFASDYDGTLCQSNWETGAEYFDPSVLEAVRAYQAAGGLFGICTGRPLFAITDSLHGILDLDFYIVTTGAQVLDRDHKTLFERHVDRDVAQELYARYASDKTALLAVTSTELVSVGCDYAPWTRRVERLDDVEGPLLGVSLESHGNETLARAMRDEMNRLFADKIEGFQNMGSVDVVAKGCSKGVGVSVVRDALGVTYVAGAGDSYNDLPLLGATDPSYTFYSSPQEVRDAATYLVEDLAGAIRLFMG